MARSLLYVDTKIAELVFKTLEAKTKIANWEEELKDWRIERFKLLPKEEKI